MWPRTLSHLAKRRTFLVSLQQVAHPVAVATFIESLIAIRPLAKKLSPEGFHPSYQRDLIGHALRQRAKTHRTMLLIVSRAQRVHGIADEKVAKKFEKDQLTTANMALLDQDSNGIADGWELNVFGMPTIANATTDTDIDGNTDVNEYIAFPSNDRRILQIVAKLPLTSL